MTEATLDLPAYLDRIGYAGPLTPGLPLLRDLIACHSTAIAFENLDIVLGRGIDIDLAALQRKLVINRRGGYCFEHNTLFNAVLGALGFDVSLMMARVVMGVAADAGSPRTHVMVRVRLPEGDFLADVGFGGQNPTAPLRLGTDAVQETPIERFRLVPLGSETLLQAEVDGDWRNAYRISPERVFPVDLEVGNWFTATRPGGLFTTHLIAARPVDGQRVTLFNGRLTVRSPNGTMRRQDLLGVEAYRPVLTELLNLRLSDEEIEAVAAGGDARTRAGLTHPAFRAD